MLIVCKFTAPKQQVIEDHVDTNVNSWGYHETSDDFADELFAISFLPFDRENEADRYLDLLLMNQTIAY